MTATPIDAHQHFLPIFGPELLAPELDRAGVKATILMQAVDTADENSRLLAYASSAPFVRGVVAWLPIADAEAAYAELERLPTPPVVGVRCLIGRDPADWLVGRSALGVFRELAARGLTWDVVPVTERQVEHTVRIAAAVPELRVVVDHMARPPLETGDQQPWARWIERLARLPNVAMKISVGIDALTAWPRWNTDALTPYVDRVVSCFDADRLMLASNWPVVLHRATYQNAWRDLTTALRRAGLSEAELAEASGGTALRWYDCRLHASE